MDKIINLQVHDQELTGAGLCSVNRTVGLMFLQVAFDETWNDYPVRTANFKRDTDSMSEAVTRVLINGSCRVPDELLKYKGTISVAIQGENTDGQTERTKPLKIIAQTQTITDGRNVIDPSPDQYTEFIERAGEAIEEYFGDHKEEFVGPPGDDYILTQEDRQEIAGIVTEDIEPILDKKMEYYVVTVENGHLVHDGQVQTYTDILNAFNDTSVFLYLSHLNLIFIPSFVVAGHEESGRDAVEFSSAYYYAEEPTIARVIINSADEIKYNQIALQDTDWKADDLTGWTIGEYPQAYPTADAVVTEFNSVKKDLSELNDSVESLDTNKAEKSELDNKVGFTDIATNSKVGVIKAEIGYGTTVSNGALRPYTYTNDEYTRQGGSLFIGKGTLENVLAERLKEPQFELIEEITLTEDVTRVQLLNGSQASLYSKIMYEITSTARIGSTPYVQVLKDDGTRSFLYGVGGALDMWGIVENSTFIAFSYARTSHNDYTNVVPYVAQTGFDILKRINTIDLFANGTQYPIVAGTNIKIYGIRA